MTHPLTKYRQVHGLTLIQFGQLVGVNGNTICRYEKQQRFPTRTVMPRIVEVTNGEVTPNDFFASAEAP